MRNNILFIAAFIVLIGFFVYATNIQHSHSLNKNFYPLTEVDVFETSTMQTPVIENLDSILPNSRLLKDSEILDEAELLLSMNDAQQIQDGLIVLNIMAERNNSRANSLLAELYDKGIRVEKNQDLALKFYEKSALSGLENANIYLFNHYLDAEDMTVAHLQNALTWFTRASNAGNNPIADYALAHIYSQGLGVDVDMDKAIKFYQRAADENFVLSYEHLGNLYLLEENDPKKISEALLLFQRAANEDIPTAQYKLGYMYAEGLGVKQDYETARFWYQRAANHNLLEAHIALGLIYENGLSIDKDNALAYNHYRIAAEAGSITGQNSIARSFERGIGVEKDLERAIYWYSQAAEQKDGNAEYNLGRIFEEYKEVANIDVAKFWYEKAAESNISEAKKALSRLQDSDE